MASKPKFLVGIGASAGGLEAIEKFLDELPVDSGGAFIVVMHLSRDFKSMLDELLARHTDMKVEAAKNDTKIEPNTVYVIQPSTIIEVSSSKLIVTNRPAVNPTGAATSIDTLFRSIADTWGDKGGAIVLSGSGSDGAIGIQAVHTNDGFTCVQSPETAKFDSMPLAAIATNAVIAVEAPELLGQTVIDGILLPSASRNSSKLSEHDISMQKIIDAVIGAADLDARQYKHSTFERRVRRRMMDLNINTLQAYAETVTEESDEAVNLSQALLIGVTDFFRDQEPYKILREKIVPEIIRIAQKEERPIRIWIPGCATGEEPYSIAMLFSEALMEMPFSIDIQIFATDISKKHLNEASRGEYSSERISNIPPELRDTYMTKSIDDDIWTINPDIRKMIVFAPHDLLSAPPFTRLDMISCRNILIYFSIAAQQKIIGSFAFGLRQRGYLFLGSSETVGGHRDSFEFLDARNRLFKRTSVAASSNSLAKTREFYPLAVNITGKSKQTIKSREMALQPAYAALLKDYAPPSILVSAEREMLHSFAGAREYIRQPEGLAQLDITEMVDSNLRTSMIAGMERAIKDQLGVTFSRIALAEFPEKDRMVDLTVKPLITEKGETPKHVLVTIDDHKHLELTSETTMSEFSPDILIQERIQELESELDRTREALQSTIEEIETANEELQASNEQLMSANEELQSTNEELSSVNEELYSVNAEYHRQNDDLSKLTRDFDMLLNATNIGVIFLDPVGKITRFTGLAGELFRLTDSDIGRPLLNFRSPFVDFEPDEFRQRSGQASEVIEIEAEHEDGDAWLLRTVSDSNNQGSVMAFINISNLRNAEEEVRNSRIILETIREKTQSFYLKLDNKREIVLQEIGFADFIGQNDYQTPQTFDIKMVHPDDREDFIANRESLSNKNENEIIYRLWNAVRQDYKYIHSASHRNEEGHWTLTAYDIDEPYTKEIELKMQQSILDATITASRAFKAFIDEEGRYKFVNDNYIQQFGLGNAKIIGKHVEDVLPKKVIEKIEAKIGHMAGGDRVVFELELFLNGENRLLSIKREPVYDDNGDIFGTVVDGLDISKIIKYGADLKLNNKVLLSAERQSNQPVMVVDVETGLVEDANYTAANCLGLSYENFEPNNVHISRITPEWNENRWSKHFASLESNTDTITNDILFFDSPSHTSRADIYTSVIEVDEKVTKAVVRLFENREKILLLDDLRERSTQLSISNRNLEQFTSVVAHDLRAPLRHISQFAQILDESLEDMPQQEIRDNVNIIGESSKSLTKMVNGLLHFGRIGHANKEFELIDLKMVIENAMDLLVSEINDINAKISLSKLPKIYGDQALLTQLFQNLIENSIKYRKPDTPLEITINPIEGKREISIAVTDNGIGITPEYAQRIFELFRRLHTEREYSGLGIGLATCRRITEIHGAEIELDTKYSNGSRFVLSGFSDKARTKDMS